MNQGEYEAILADATKQIDGDIFWSEDEDHSPAAEFRSEVTSSMGFPLFVVGSFNRRAATLSYSLIHRGAGRVYGLDMGKEHHNPQCTFVGETHKHTWSEQLRDKEAYSPEDVTAPTTDAVVVWQQFCQECNLTHSGQMAPPPAQQEELF